MKVYKKKDLMPKILCEIPEFQQDWESYLQEWYEEGEPQLLHIDIGEFCHFTLDAIEKKKKSLIKRIFNLIEEIFVQSDEEVFNAIYVSYLESLTNRPKVVAPYLKYLGPKSKEAVRELDEFWGTKTPGLD